MKIVVTNDDGIDAPGLEVLEKILRPLGRTVVVAPAGPQSGIAHRVTVHAPLRLESLAPDRFSLTGTPADCSRVALKWIAPDADWVVAGINPGANLGSDVYNSGTVAAAREAAVLDCRSMAVSQYIAQDLSIDWQATAEHAATAVRRVLQLPLAPKHFWNVNLPHPLTKGEPPDFQFCGLDTQPHLYSYRLEGRDLRYAGSIHQRPRDPGRDVEVCFGGKVSITRIALGTTSLNTGPIDPLPHSES